MSAAAGTRTRAAHLGPDRRRPQVLDTALDIAVSDGLAAVTIGAIAGRMGVTRPVVYACFADRIDLVEALLHRESAVLTESLVAALHSSGGYADPNEAFIAGFRTRFDYPADTDDEFAKLYSSDVPDVAFDWFEPVTTSLLPEVADA